MEETYEHKYLKYKLKYLKMKYELEGAGFFKSDFEKAMDKIYEQISEYIEKSNEKKILKKNLKNIITKNPLIDKEDKNLFDQAKKKLDLFRGLVKTQLKRCNDIHDELSLLYKNTKPKHHKLILKMTTNLKKIEERMKKRHKTLTNSDMVLKIKNLGNSLSEFEPNETQIKKIHEDFKEKKYDTNLVKNENELKLYIKFWLMQWKFCNKLRTVMYKISSKTLQNCEKYDLTEKEKNFLYNAK